MIDFEEVTKLYGSVIGVNDINLSLEPGSYGLLGPNGSGKTTLLNLITGQLKATQGRVQLFGASPILEKHVLHRIGFCPAVDLLLTNVTGFDWVTYLLELQGYDRQGAVEKTNEAFDIVGLDEARHRSIGGYSRGMKQRCKLAQAISHDPDLLILDEPFTGVDPVGRHNLSELFCDWVANGKSLLVASHVLHEVDLISDRVILIANGHVIAEGDVRGMRDEMDEHPRQYVVRCRDASRLASKLFEQDHIAQIQVHEDRLGLLVMTRSQNDFARALGRLAVDGHRIESVMAVDENVDALYKYLIGGGA